MKLYSLKEISKIDNIHYNTVIQRRNAGKYIGFDVPSRRKPLYLHPDYLLTKKEGEN